MGKMFTISTHVKRILILLFVALFAFTLTSCDSDKKPAGELDFNAIYASKGDLQVTVGDLYDEFRFNSTTYLEKVVNEVLYKNEIESVNADLASENSQYKERITNAILEDIYGTSEEDEIAKMKEDELEKSINKYVDSVKQEGYSITKEQINNKDFSSVYGKYILDVAKFAAAKNAYLEEIKGNNDTVTYYTKEDGKAVFASDAKISQDDVITYYDNNYKNQGDVDGILVRTVSSTEASNILKAFGLKTYNNYWYQIDLPEDLESDVYTSKAKYDEYYTSATIDPTSESGNSSINLAGAGYATVLKVFAEIYNYVYQGFRNRIVYDDALTIETFKASHEEMPSHLLYYNFIKEIIAKDAEYRNAHLTDGEFTAEAEEEYLGTIAESIKAYGEANNNYTILSNERLNKYNSSLATYVYETLATENKEDGTYTRYTSSAKSYGSYYFFFFKIAQAEDVKLYDEKDEDGKTVYEINNFELLDEIIAKVLDEKITSSYISEVYEKRASDVKLSIYDSVIELMFTQSDSTLNENYKKTRKSDKNNIASVTYNGNTTDFSVVDFYNYMDNLYGSRYAMQLLFNEFIKTTDKYKDLEAKYKDYEDSLKMMLYYFQNDYYTSYGYQSTMGKYNFLMAIYHSAVSDEIIRDNMMVSDAKSAYFRDYTHTFSTEEFTNKLVEYLNASYDEYYSMGATQINIYVDYDEDDEADEITTESAAYPLMQSLMNEVVKYVNTSTEAFSSAISSFISDYKATARFEDTNPTTNESKWAKYRSAGLYVSTSSVSASNETKLNSELQALIEKYYNDQTVVDSELGLTSNVLTSEAFLDENNYSKLLLSSASLKVDATFDDEDKFNELYKLIPTSFNDKLIEESFTLEDYNQKQACLKAITIYIHDYLLLGDVNSLPAEVVNYLDTYLLPLLTRYTSSASQYTIMNNVLSGITYNKRANGAQEVSDWIAYSQNTLDDYDSTKYPNWWVNLYNKGAK